MNKNYYLRIIKPRLIIVVLLICGSATGQGLASIYPRSVPGTLSQDRTEAGNNPLKEVSKASDRNFITKREVPVTGKVTSEAGEPLPGVSVSVKGTTIGSITDANGTYSLNVPDGNATLVYSYVGMVTQEIALNGRSTVEVSLKADVEALEEVVVVGYTTTDRKNLASSYGVVKSEDIRSVAVSDVQQTLQGKLAGVQVVNNGGVPGAGSKMVIRGIGSFTSTDPLYVIDGIQGGDINSIPQTEIESITVLKDAASTAIYGSAAANGVVIVTTKSGKRGGLAVTYDGSMGYSEVTKRYDLLNASQYVDLVGDIQKAGGLAITPKLESAEVRKDVTDWQDAIFRKGAFSQHNIGIGGATENVSYQISGGYTSQESTVIDRLFRRAQFGTKLNEHFGRFKFSQNLRVRYDHSRGKLADFGDALRLPPYIGIYDSTNLGGFARTDKTTDLNDANNPYNLYNSDFNRRDLGLNLELAGEVQILKFLSFKSQGRITGQNYRTATFNRPSAAGNSVRATSDMTESYFSSIGYILENFLSFNHSTDLHSFNAIVGTTYGAPSTSSKVDLAGSGFPNENIQSISLANTRTITSSEVNSQKARISYFAQLAYTFKNRYILNASFRRDGSSVFGSNYRFGNFPGVGIGWNVSEENFMANVPIISLLKIRASYGVTGNDNIDNFLTSPTIYRGDANNIVYSFGDGPNFSTGSTIGGLPNPNLRWEETRQTDVGLEVGLLDNALNLTFDYYTRKNDDLLINAPLPGSVGITEFQWLNAASMKNKGFEMSASYGAQIGALKYNISLNGTYNQNEVTGLGTANNTPISTGEWQGGVGNATRTDIGRPIGSFFGYVVDHVAVSQTEVDALNESANQATSGAKTEYAAGLKPGDFVFKDVDGNGFVDGNDRTFIGNPTPKYQYGASINLGYKGIDLGLTGFGVADVDVVNGLRYQTEGMSKPFNQTTNTLRRWKQDGDVTDMPAAAQNSGRNLAFSTWYVENGTYFRLRNITLGYTLPVNTLSSLTNNVIKAFRIYVTAQNLFTLTKYSGYDPEVSSATVANNNDNQGFSAKDYIFNRGIDNFQYPNPKTYRVGLQLTF